MPLAVAYLFAAAMVWGFNNQLQRPKERPKYWRMTVQSDTVKNGGLNEGKKESIYRSDTKPVKNRRKFLRKKG